VQGVAGVPVARAVPAAADGRSHAESVHHETLIGAAIQEGFLTLPSAFVTAAGSRLVRASQGTVSRTVSLALRALRMPRANAAQHHSRPIA
jgi:hypothetical protein